MENNVSCRNMLISVYGIVAVLTGLTVLVFLSSYVSYLNFYGTLIKVFGILYLFGFIALVLLVREVYVCGIMNRAECPEVKIVEKPVYIEKKARATKKYTGSTFKKIYHRRSCRFSESIMDKYFEEDDDRAYFVGKKYKPCGLCKPQLAKKVVDDNIKEDKE